MRSYRILLPVSLLLVLVMYGFAPAQSSTPSEESVAGVPALTWRLIPPDNLIRPPRPWPGDDVIVPRLDRMHVGLDILVDGRPMRTVYHAGRMYAPVNRLGDKYEIRVNNHGPRRITAVVSVDGLSVVTGQPASKNDPGYIVAPNDSVVIKGWRRDRHTVAAFSFEDRTRSHAYETGRLENIGVIGLIAYEEASPRPLPIERYGLPDAAAPAMRKATSEVGGTGTGYGPDVPMSVIRVPFDRSSNTRTVTLYYDTMENLRRSGVPVEPRWPEPFPRDR
jgi:hypothetical protein